MKNYIIHKPNIKDPRTDKYVGGKYQIITETIFQQCGSSMKRYFVKEIAESDVPNLGWEGLYNTNEKGELYYYQIVDPNKVFLLKELADLEPLNNENINSKLESESELEASSLKALPKKKSKLN